MVNPDVNIRYAHKIRTYCDGLNPYMLKLNKGVLPTGVQLFDIQIYMMEHHNSHSRETFSAYKSTSGTEMAGFRNLSHTKYPRG